MRAMTIARRAAAAALAAALVVSATGGAYSVGSARPLPPSATVGSGKTLCHDWLAARKRRDPSLASLQQWVLGYLSGYNAFAPPPKDMFTDYDSTSVLGWVDTRCAQNPTSSVSAVLNDFVAQLARSRSH
jgi:hypothetical protein